SILGIALLTNNAAGGQGIRTVLFFLGLIQLIVATLVMCKAMASNDITNLQTGTALGFGIFGINNLAVSILASLRVGSEVTLAVIGGIGATLALTCWVVTVFKFPQTLTNRSVIKPTMFLGRYRIIEEIGHGGMGIVYEAEDVVLQRHVAVKVLHPNDLKDPLFVEHFRNESVMVANLQHPHVCVLFDIQVIDSQILLIMELLEGETMDNHLPWNGTQEHFDRLISWFLQLVDALECCHLNQIIHRDVKPRNVFITSDGHVKLIDFGVAQLSEHAMRLRAGISNADFSSEGPKGSFAYMAPEQAHGKADFCSDFYSLGIMLKEAFHHDKAKYMGSLLSLASEMTAKNPRLRLIDPGEIKQRLAQSR
ncbi:MAG TPA: serine/threonine-protein kinase, partial [Pirellula sp.]|nr:serine/threonine-protein kinase [Pirellula sp.]